MEVLKMLGKEQKVFIDPIEAVALSHTTQTGSHDLLWNICRIYGAWPLKAHEQDFFSFLSTVFNAGRVSGIRQERAKRKRVTA